MNLIEIKQHIFNFISMHETQISNDMKKRDENIKITFTTFGNLAGCRALYDIIKIFDDDMKSNIVDMMRNKRVV